MVAIVFSIHGDGRAGFANIDVYQTQLLLVSLILTWGHFASFYSHVISAVQSIFGSQGDTLHREHFNQAWAFL